MSSHALEVLQAPWMNALVALLLNVPFGYWRGGCRRWSRGWFLAIHIPVVLTVGLRFCLGTPFRLDMLPLYALAFVVGQFFGARIHAGVPGCGCSGDSGRNGKPFRSGE
jgi:hypothetical protein